MAAFHFPGIEDGLVTSKAKAEPFGFGLLFLTEKWSRPISVHGPRLAQPTELRCHEPQTSLRELVLSPHEPVRGSLVPVL